MLLLLLLSLIFFNANFYFEIDLSTCGAHEIQENSKNSVVHNSQVTDGISITGRRWNSTLEKNVQKTVGRSRWKIWFCATGENMKWTVLMYLKLISR